MHKNRSERGLFEDESDVLNRLTPWWRDTLDRTVVGQGLIRREVTRG